MVSATLNEGSGVQTAPSYEGAVRDVLETALEDGGFFVTKAFTAEQAIEMLDSEATLFRALVSDINLGTSNLSGWEVVKTPGGSMTRFPSCT
jgi:CheY-like chemotaxis protein